MKNRVSTKTRLLERYVNRLQELLDTKRFQSLSARKKQQIIKRIQRLQRQLSNLVTSKRVKRVLASAAVVLGLAIAPLQAQNFEFKPVQTNPFNLNFPAGQQFYFNLPTLGDLDNDGDYDMMIGDYSGSFSYFENIGDSTSASFSSLQPTVPLGLPAGNNNFRIPTLVDIDGDGDLDVVSAEYTGIYLYTNTGTSSSPAFAAPVQNAFGFPFNYNTGIKFADIDDDGDLDAFLISAPAYGGITYYENTGSATNPTFPTSQSNPFGLTPSSYSLFIEIGDIDGDGDYDIITGEYYYGNINYYENIGNKSTPSFAAGITNANGINMTGPDVYFVTPALADMDDDGDLDLVAGEYSDDSYYGGIIRYQENNQAPMSADTNVTTIKNTDYTFTGNEFIFTDSDDMSMVSLKIASLPAKGTLQLSGTPVMAGDSIPVADLVNLVFSPEADSIGMPYTTFEFQVMDSIMTSADTNLLTINVDAPVGLAKLLDETSITLAPNPTTNWLNIEIYATEPIQQANLVVMDISGRVIRQEDIELPEGQTNKTISTSDLVNGVYFLMIETERGILRERFVKQ